KWTTKNTGSATCKCGFVQFFYEPIKQIINTCMNDRNDKLWPMLTNLGVTMKFEEKELMASAPDVVKQVKSIEKVDTQRNSAKQKSAGLRAGKSRPTIDLHEIKYDASQQLENMANENESTSLGSNNVASLRRQSTLFKHVNPEQTEDFFDIHDSKFEVSNFCDNLSESLPAASNGTSENCTFDPHERRSSISRPLRQSALKVVSYNKVPLNMKMRRDN
ncbi:hypothetical protein RYX36_035161, partial [Vicia faba]